MCSLVGDKKEIKKMNKISVTGKPAKMNRPKPSPEPNNPLMPSAKLAPVPERAVLGGIMPVAGASQSRNSCVGDTSLSGAAKFLKSGG